MVSASAVVAPGWILSFDHHLQFDSLSLMAMGMWEEIDGIVLTAVVGALLERSWLILDFSVHLTYWKSEHVLYGLV